MIKALKPNDCIVLEADWTFELSSLHTTKRMWSALGCDSDPDNKSAWERWQTFVDEIQAIHFRAPEVPIPQQVWDQTEKRWVTNPTRKQPKGKDARRIKELQSLIQQEERQREYAMASLPTGTKLRIEDLHLQIQEQVCFKLNVVETEHPGLAFTHAGGRLSRGKRPLIVRSNDLVDATFRVEP
jgi:hypothetical protein